MYSMTGYGRAEYFENGLDVLVEIKTVNNRNFDFNSKMPRSFIMFEDEIRKTVNSYVSRGRVDLFLTFSDKRETASSIEVNLEKAVEYYNASVKISQKLNISNDVTVSSIMRLNDVLEDAVKNDVTEFKDVILSTVKNACESLNKMRKIEGEKLVTDMLNRIETIKSLREKISTRAPLVAIEYKNRLKARIEEALLDVKYDEVRLLNEVAFYTDKVNIDEELTRLNSHVNQFCDIIKTPSAGKRLDFLMQEFNREANTICSKSNDIDVTTFALSLKNEIEKIREQVQNLE